MREPDLHACWRHLLAAQDSEPLPPPASEADLDALELRLGRALLRISGTPFPDLLADRAAADDVDCARALARLRDQRAFGPLAAELGGPNQRSAVTGLRDLRSEEALPLLQRIVDHDPDDDVATLAAHGMVMADPAAAAIAARSLARRRDPDVQDLAAHWLSLLE